MEEKLFTQSDLSAIANELSAQIKTLQERNANLALMLNQANAEIRKLDNKLKEVKPISKK